MPGVFHVECEYLWCLVVLLEHNLRSAAALLAVPAQVWMNQGGNACAVYWCLQTSNARMVVLLSQYKWSGNLQTSSASRAFAVLCSGQQAGKGVRLLLAFKSSSIPTTRTFCFTFKVNAGCILSGKYTQQALLRPPGAKPAPGGQDDAT
jgi:hypothetical protein